VAAGVGADAAVAGAEGDLLRQVFLDRDARVTIRFALPDAPGGVSGAGGEGVLVIEGAEEGRLRVVARRFVDRRTGGVSAVLDPAEDAIAATLSLIRCAGAAEGAKLRGRS
jgi:hypothetical protein